MKKTAGAWGEKCKLRREFYRAIFNQAVQCPPTPACPGEIGETVDLEDEETDQAVKGLKNDKAADSLGATAEMLTLIDQTNRVALREIAHEFWSAKELRQSSQKPLSQFYRNQARVARKSNLGGRWRF